MKKIIFTVFSILIILTTIFFIAIGTVRDSRYYILILVYIIVYKIILSFTNRSKKSKSIFFNIRIKFFCIIIIMVFIQRNI